jgi:hypothetical protein
MEVVKEAVVMFVALYTCSVTDVQKDSSDWF